MKYNLKYWTLVLILSFKIATFQETACDVLSTGRLAQKLWNLLFPNGKPVQGGASLATLSTLSGQWSLKPGVCTLYSMRALEMAASATDTKIST